MKVFTTVLKIVAALAAIAGIIYVIAAYGDKIVAWAKEMLVKLGWQCDAPVKTHAEEIIDTEEVPTEEPVVEPSAEEDTVQADETDFENQ